MRTKVRGLREIEREVLAERAADAAPADAAPADAAPADAAPAEAAPADAAPAVAEPDVAEPDVATPAVAESDVVLDYCAAVRGILNDNHGGPLQPPGERMAEALTDVRQSLQRNLEAKKGGPRRTA
jgi:hypothetical protein